MTVFLEGIVVHAFGEGSAVNHLLNFFGNTANALKIEREIQIDVTANISVKCKKYQGSNR